MFLIVTFMEKDHAAERWLANWMIWGLVMQMCVPGLVDIDSGNDLSTYLRQAIDWNNRVFIKISVANLRHISRVNMTGRYP